MRDRTAGVHENGFTDVVLVCTNDRDSEYACCADARGPAVFEAVRTWLCDRGVFWSHVHVAETGCLGLRSAEGTAIAIHPRDRWYSDVRPGDVPDLLRDEFGEDGSVLGAAPGTPGPGRSARDCTRCDSPSGGTDLGRVQNRIAAERYDMPLD